ncbi:MAG: hypothetical protein D6726_03275, partial [Nitrospirae bacterium]
MKGQEGFQKGFLIYEVLQVETPVSVNPDQWDDGYLAYSTVEERLSAVKGKDKDLKTLFSSHTGDSGRGYLMEADLWRERDGVYEEMSIEREDGNFLIQTWRLYGSAETPPEQGALRCFYRHTKTMPRGLSLERGLFKEEELKSIEVVVPERRLHFFITVKEGGD